MTHSAGTGGSGSGIDETSVRSPVREHHPDLAGLNLREVVGGRDSQLWPLGDELAVRMPRTARAPSLLRNEPRTIATWVPGEPADRAAVTRDQHTVA